MNMSYSYSDIEKIKILIKDKSLCGACPFNNIRMLEKRSINICKSKCYKVFPDLAYTSDLCPCKVTKNQKYILLMMQGLKKYLIG